MKAPLSWRLAALVALVALANLLTVFAIATGVGLFQPPPAEPCRDGMTLLPGRSCGIVLRIPTGPAKPPRLFHDRA